MIQIFQDIVAGDAQAVQDRLAKDPALIAAVAKGSSKKFVGQSPLQVAIQTGQTQIARLLIAAGADPNHADLDSPSGAGRPLIHDAVTFAIKSARWTRPVSFAPPITEWEIVGSEEAATEWFELVAALLDAGADASALGQAGTSVGQVPRSGVARRPSI